MGRPGGRRGTQRTPRRSATGVDLFAIPFEAPQPETPEERLNRMLREYSRPPAPRRPSFSESQMAAWIRQVMSIPTEVDVRNQHGRVHLALSGATLELLSGEHGRMGVSSSWGSPENMARGAEVYAENRQGDFSARIAASLERPLQLRTQYRDLRFQTTLTPERWEMSLSWGSAGPPLDQLGEIFSQGEAGARSILGEVARFDAGELNADNVAAIRSRVEPHLAPVSRAVRTASQIRSVRTGVSFSIRASGPLNGGGDAAQIQGLLTIRF